MKGFICAVILLLVVVVGLFFFHAYITSSFDAFLKEVDKVEELLNSEEFEECLYAFSNFEKNFDKNSHILSFFIDRAPIDNALTEISRTRNFIKEEDKAESLASLSGLKTILERIVEKSLLKVENIL